MYKFGDKVQLKPREGYMSRSRKDVLGQDGIVIARAYNDVYSVVFECREEFGFVYQTEFCTEDELSLVR